VDMVDTVDTTEDKQEFHHYNNVRVLDTNRFHIFDQR